MDETASLERFMEHEARRETMKAYFHRHRGRLFPLPDIDCGRDRRIWQKLTDAYWGKAVGVVPPDDSGEHLVCVGIWAGFAPSYLGGWALCIEHFNHPGCTTHRSPFNVGYVHVLSRRFQMIAEAQWREDESEVWAA